MSEKKLVFDASLSWLEERAGQLTASDASGSIRVETPPAFGGKGNPWTPEHLFLGAINSCFMTTYLAFADKFHFRIKDMTCHVTGQVELVEGKYRFTQIDVYPVIFIDEESVREKATQALAKTQQYCLVSNSISANLQYHSEVKLVSEKAARKEAGKEIVL